MSKQLAQAVRAEQQRIGHEAFQAGFRAGIEMEAQRRRERKILNRVRRLLKSGTPKAEA